MLSFWLQKYIFFRIYKNKNKRSPYLSSAIVYILSVYTGDSDVST